MLGLGFESVCANPKPKGAGHCLVSLRHNGMCDAGGRSLADAIVRRDCSLGSLVALDLSQNNISDMALTTLKAALATVPSVPPMRRLFYSNADGRVCHSLTAARAS